MSAITPPFSQGRFTAFCFCSSAASSPLFYSPFSRPFFHHHMLQASRKQSTKNNRTAVNQRDAMNCSFILHSISGPGSFLCALSNYVIWTPGRFGIRGRRWLAWRENVGIIGWQISLLVFPLLQVDFIHHIQPQYCHILHIYFTSCTPGPLAEELDYSTRAASLSILTSDGSRS